MKNSKKTTPLSKAQMKTIVGGRRDLICDLGGHAGCELHCKNIGYTTGTCFPDVGGDCECINIGE